MNTAETNLILDTLLNYEPHFISDKTRFWMVRTKKGYFYNEFVTKGYIALGWNIITSSLNITDSTRDDLKDELNKIYGDSRPGVAINKCVNFIREMKNGDIVLIPSVGSNKITFARVGDYYEVPNLDYNDELIVNEQINNYKTFQGINIACPYLKRRYIDVIKTVKASRINMHLMKTIGNYNSISCLDEYAKIILDEIYSAYSYKGISSLQVTINSKKDLNAVAVTKLLANVTELMSYVFDANDLVVSINLNSPGKISISKKDNQDGESEDKDKNGLLRNLFNKGKETKSICIIFGILVILTGGEFKDLKLNGIPQIIRDIKTVQVDVEVKKQELKGIELQNLEKEIEIYNTLQESDININKLIKNIDEINEIRERLEVGEVEESNKDMDDDNGISFIDENTEDEDD